MDPKDASKVKGFLTAEFEMPLPDGRTLHGLTEDGFRMVMEGYACGECLAYFNTFQLRCPVCKSELHPEEVVPAPQHWIDHIAERYSDVPYEKPPVVNPFDAIKQVMENPEVEKTPLKQLSSNKKRRMH